jgi:hypothetical protein
MSRSGFSKQQQNQLKQLVYQCSFARIPASEISRLALEKLNTEVTENWVGSIRTSLKHDAEKEYKHLLSDSFAYRYEFLQRIKEVKEIQRRKWEIANKEHLTNEDLIRLKCLTELEESTVLLSDFYQMLPGMDSFVPEPGLGPDLGSESDSRRSVFRQDLGITHHQGPDPSDPDRNPPTKF